MARVDEAPSQAAGANQPFDIDAAMAQLREATRSLPKAVMFQLADEGFSTLFEQLVACIISIRTLDEVSLPTSLKLFETLKNFTSLKKVVTTPGLSP